MGKLITMWVFLDRRSFGNATEEDARRQRGFNEWMRSRFAPHSKPPRPQVQPGSKVRLKVVSRRRP